MKLIGFLVLLAISWITSVSASCDVSIKGIQTTHPLFIQQGTSNFVSYDETGNIKLSTGQGIELFCPSTYTYPAGKSGSQYATCQGGTTFTIGGVTSDLAMVSCSDWISPTSRKMNMPCNGGVLIETGFTVGTRFVKQLEICFDEILEVTRYVHHTLQPGSNFHQNNVPRTNFKTLGFFNGKNVNNLYSPASVALAFQRQLGSATGRYSSNLERGHMAATVDFVYGAQQRGTFLFLNAAPQWPSINKGNWKKIEYGTRVWVSKNKKHVDCYTGVYGIATLPNTGGIQKPLYLDYDADGNGLIPVPLLYFRVIIEPSTNRGVVLITVNNPYQALPSSIVCPDVSSRIDWINWRKTVQREGYSYACEVDEFAKINPHLPRFHVTSLLY